MLDVLRVCPCPTSGFSHVPYLMASLICVSLFRDDGVEGVGACCGRTHRVQQDAGRSLQDTLNAAKTEGRVLVGPPSVLCQGNCARETKRKSLSLLKHNESVLLTIGV